MRKEIDPYIPKWQDRRSNANWIPSQKISADMLMDSARLGIQKENK
jgi:hypothetical protein